MHLPPTKLPSYPGFGNGFCQEAVTFNMVNHSSVRWDVSVEAAKFDLRSDVIIFACKARKACKASEVKEISYCSS